MKKPNWRELAVKGLERALPPDRIDGARSAIDLKLMFASAGLRRHLAFEREIYVFTQFAGKTLRIVIEANDPPIVWHVGVQPDRITE
ncbi:MAG: hypothetical protein K2Z25_19765 [Beijerinckiaceae bacterium]|nr:hypothetical protein [Beijerinckiaceae bacterium]